MRFLSSFLSLLTVAALLAPSAVEAKFIPRTDPISRPSHRTLEVNARAYRSEMASYRRGFDRQLSRIEALRDARRAEYYRAEAPEYIIDQQGFVPFHTYRFRRSVRRFHWNSEFQEEPEADVGQGPAGQ